MSSTMSDIAKKAGTSVAAVSVTLNGAKSKTLRVGPETRQRILLAAQELGYRRNPLASALASGRSKVVGLMLPDLDALARHDPFYSLVTTGVITCASLSGYSIVLYAMSSEEPGLEDHRHINKMIAGMVFVSPPSETPLFEECRRQHIPFATLMAGSAGGALTVDSADFRGGQLATRHLLDLGHRRIAHLEGRPGVSTTEPRKQGYFDALSDYEIPIRPELCLPGHFNRTDGYRATRELLRLPIDRRPTAIFAANDLAAHGAIEAICDAGLTVPGDISVVGYDDTWYATVSRPALTSVRMDVEGVGKKTCEMLLHFIENGGPSESHLVLPVSLTVRESTGPCR